MPPEAEEPVLPLVPEPLLVPALPPVDGVVAVDEPEAPMPELVPELEVPPEGLAVDEEEGVTEPLADPPVDPMPEAVPDAEPDMLGPEPQALRAAAQARARMVLLIVELLESLGGREARHGGCASRKSRMGRGAGWEQFP